MGIVMVPNCGVFTKRFGVPRLTMLRALNASPRNWKLADLYRAYFQRDVHRCLLADLLEVDGGVGNWKGESRAVPETEA